MENHSLTPVFAGLRTGLHALVATLLTLVAVRVAMGEASSARAAFALTLVFAGTYIAGARLARIAAHRRAIIGAIWLAGLTLVWIALLAMVPEAAYLVFPLFFLYLHLLPSPGGPIAVLAATVVAILALGEHDRYTWGAVVGPVVGAGVALLIGLGYRALARESAEREALLVELVDTRDRLAATEREQGILAERARLGRELHDTVAQGLSSIQMLLHAAERAAPESPGVGHLQLARATAADVLGETRRFIRELSPPSLEQGLPDALRRLAEFNASIHGLLIEVHTPDSVELPMDVQTALLRVAQGALANVIQHAQASRVLITLTDRDARTTMTLADDGTGFDPALASAAAPSDSFGLRAITERMEQLGGTFQIDTAPGRGTSLSVTVNRSTS